MLHCTLTPIKANEKHGLYLSTVKAVAMLDLYYLLVADFEKLQT